MKAEKSNPIIGITLEGFQVFDKPTYIPLDQLTLMFGPNSAGKSATQDALALCRELLKVEFIQGNMVDGKAQELIKRHWRRMGSETSELAETMSVGIRYSLEDDFEYLNGRTDHGENKAYFHAPVTVESRWTFHRVGRNQFSFFGSFEFFLESELLMRNSQTLGERGYSTGFSVNFENPLIRQFPFRFDCSEISRGFPNQVTFINGMLTVVRGTHGFRCSGRGVEEERERWLSYYLPTDELGSLLNFEPLQKCIAELGDVIGNILFISNQYADFYPDTVDASRTVPSDGDLTFLLGSPNANSISDLESQLLPNRISLFRKLAASLAGMMPNYFYWDKELASKVNFAFSHHLLLEQGYQVDCERRMLLSPSNSASVRSSFDALDEDNEKDGSAEDGRKVTVKIDEDTHESGLLVQLFLRDGKGNKHSFQDVGSGIGYVLPVLCSIFDQSAIYTTPCLIQQPELHLHPAMQAAMGDVFIEASGSGKQILVETHSEHLLLRILKRIRQTHLQIDIAPDLKIAADDLCVLYFNPTVDGTTTVKRLRITEDGEFMDRWPRGFFGERDQELLDE